MEVSTKMLRYIVVLNAIFAATWAAALPIASSGSSLKDRLCSENATLNTTAECPTIAAAAMKPSNVTLTKEFENLCEHAVDLVVRICEHTRSDNKLGEEVVGNVTRLFSEKIPLDKEFCDHALRKSQEDYKANAETLGYFPCVAKCVLPNDTMKPLCMFVQWSWKFLFDQSKVTQEIVKNQEAGEQAPVKDDETHTSSPKINGSNPGVAKDSPGNPSSPDSGPAKPVQTSQGKDEMGNVPSKDKNPPSPSETLKNVKTDPVEDPKPEAAPKNLETSVLQPNRPLEQSEEELKISESEGKGSTTNTEDTVKTNQEPPNVEDDLNQFDGDNPGAGDDLHHQKPPSSDQKNGKDMKADESPGSVEDDPLGNIDADPEGEEKSKEPVWPRMSNAQSQERLTAKMDEFSEAEDSHFFVFFFIATFICILFYLIYQNKRKIIAMALEGKKGRHSSRRRPTSASYQKLDNKLDEVMAASPPPSKTHVIY